MEDDDAWLYGDDQPTENSVTAEVKRESEVSIHQMMQSVMAWVNSKEGFNQFAF